MAHFSEPRITFSFVTLTLSPSRVRHFPATNSQVLPMHEEGGTMLLPATSPNDFHLMTSVDLKTRTILEVKNRIQLLL